MKQVILSSLIFAWISLIKFCSSLNNDAAVTPAMGWSTWNHFALDYNETIILQIADQMIKLGLRNAGYEYLNIDAGYIIGRNSTTNKLIVDSTKFPNGLRYISDYLHSINLKFGLYTDISNGTCFNGAGSFGHYTTDALTFANEWVMLVYIPYIWLFFAKLYHNEIVRYFNQINLLNLIENVHLRNKHYLKTKAKVDTILFWLKMIIFSSFLCFRFCCQRYMQDAQNKQHNYKWVSRLWLVHTVASWTMLVNSILALSCFVVIRESKCKCC